MVRYLLAASAIVALAAPMVAPAQDAGMPFENVQPDRFEMPGSLVNAWAVSYTHLDVYKSQGRIL